MVFEIEVPLTAKAPAPPLRPMLVPAVLGCKITVAVSAFRAPVVLRFTEPAVTLMFASVVDTVNPLLTLTAPVP